MAYTFSFEKLESWQLARELTKEIYKISKHFPDEEKYTLTSQIRRSCISISSNLAEGSSRTSSKDQAHFSQLAYSSLCELVSQLILSMDLDYIEVSEYVVLKEELNKLANKINALRKSQLKRLNP